MKKNRAMRAASALLVAVLMTTCTISGTFAKYVTSAEAQDTARVAEWGVTVTAYGEEVFVEDYVNAAGGNTAATGATGEVLTVESNTDGEDVVAPGTTGTLGTVAISGTPEVMVDIDVTADLNLGTGWKVTGDWDGDGTIETDETNVEYCPIVFTVGGTEIKMDATNNTVAKLEAAVEKVFTDLSSATNIAANTPLTRNVAVDWEWPYIGDDAKDTALGNLAAAPTIAFTYSAIVTQVD